MARETLPESPAATAWDELGADSRDLDLDLEMEITRERLDGTPLAGWRAPLAAWAERASGWLGAPVTPPAMPVARGGRSPASPATSSRQTARGRLLRQGAVALLITATLFTLLNGVGATRAALAALDRAMHPPRPLLTLADSEYTLQNLPPRAQHTQHISIAPMAGDPSAAYICWVDLFESGGDSQGGPVFIYQTANGGRSWRPSSAPASQGVDCAITTDRAGGAGALLTITPGYTLGGLCETPQLFLTLDGQTWSEVARPRLGFAAPCTVQYALVGSAIYAWSSDTYASGALPFSGSGRLIVTRDGGATWTNADSGLNDGPGLTIVGFQAGGRILATIPDVRGQAGSVTLMESTDYGATWRSHGDPPGVFDMVYATADPARTNDWGRLYVLARPVINGATSPSRISMLATAPHAGAPWTDIPLPPFVTGDDSDPNVSTPTVLGVGPRDALFVERGAVPANNKDVLSQPRRLWAWLPGQREWALDPQPTFGNIDDLAWGWSSGAWTVWVTSLQLGVPPTLHLFTRAYTAADLTPSTT